MSSSPTIIIPSLTPNGDSLRNFIVGIEYSDNSENFDLNSYAVFVHNIPTGEIRTTQVGLSSAQALDVATVIFDAIYYAE